MEFFFFYFGFTSVLIRITWWRDWVSRGVLNIWSCHSSFFARVIIILKVRFKDCVKTRNQNVHRKKNKMSCKNIANLFLPLLTLANLAVYINYNN